MIITRTIYFLFFLSNSGLCYQFKKERLGLNFNIRGSKIEQIEYAQKSNIILYDGFCNFCNKWVDVLIAADTKKLFTFSALQSVKGKELLQKIGKQKDDISSVVYIKSLGSATVDSEVYTKSDAAIKVLETLGYYPLTAAAILPSSLRDNIYDIVALNRYKILGKRNECRCGDMENKDRFL